MTTITPTDLKQLMKEDPALQVLDVRSGAEFESVHIPGSVNVPLDALGRVGHDIAQADGTFVLVCQSGARAEQAQARLADAGKAGLVVLEGGISGWQSVDGTVEKGVQRWAMDRQVRLTAGTIVLTAVLASTAFPRAKWIAGAVGAGLTYSAVSNTCAMASMLSKLPYNKTPNCDVDTIVAELVGA